MEIFAETERKFLDLSRQSQRQRRICICRKKIAEVFSDGENDADALEHARLISAAPEMHIALIGAVEALRAIEIFMSGQGLETDELDKIVRTIDELLDRVDEAQEI